MKNEAMLNTEQKAIRIILFFVLGILSGFLAKYIDTIPSNGIIGSLINIISNISSRIGIWVFIATIIAAWSRTPKAGAIHVFAFFVGMLLAYYISEEGKRYVFLHELAHFERKDILINWIIMLVQILHWFNPIVWYAFYKMHEDCEIACDAYVLSRLKPVEYKKHGETIINLIQSANLIGFQLL
jgi:hypothetical protein